MRTLRRRNSLLVLVGLLALLPLVRPATGQDWDQCLPGEERPWNTGPYDIGYYDTAADFTLNQLDDTGQSGATWTYSSIWPGCDNVIFFLYSRTSCYSVYTTRSEPDILLETSPRNVHYVFISITRLTGNETPADFAQYALDDAQTIRTDFETALAAMDPADAAWWRPRLHYSTDHAYLMGDWWPNFLQNTFFTAHPYFGWGIDRFQRLRNIGMQQDPNFVIECTPGDPSTQTWFPRTSHLANEARYWNFEWYREEQLAQETFTTVDVWQERFNGNIYADVTFPSSEEMADYDTMLFDLELLCYDRNGDTVIASDDCEWDYLIYAYICDKDDPTSCGTEMGRWITTYGRDGRWVVDVSPFLAFLRDGGQRRLRFYSQNAYDITFKILLTNRGKGYRPHSATYLYSGGGFGLDYNANHPPRDVYVPDWTSNVDLVAYITGHGFGSGQNCAEFCNHEHFFRFNLASPYSRSHPMVGDQYGCMAQIDQELGGFGGPGTVANQFGTWVYGRGGWCPGLDVKPWVQDVTRDLVLGDTNRVTYEGYLDGQPCDPANGTCGNIRMNSWLVYNIKMAETDCTDTIDNDNNGQTDCEDYGCWGHSACIDLDFDGDGWLNRDDCEPFEGGAFAAPFLDLLHVTRDPTMPGEAVVGWDDLSVTAGTGTTYDVIQGTLDDLHLDGGFAGATCSRDLASNSLIENGPGNWYFLVRARNFCGTTSFGRNTGGVCD